MVSWIRIHYSGLRIRILKNYLCIRNTGINNCYELRFYFKNAYVTRQMHDWMCVWMVARNIFWKDKTLSLSDFRASQVLFRRKIRNFIKVLLCSLSRAKSCFCSLYPDLKLKTNFLKWDFLDFFSFLCTVKACNFVISV